MPSPEERLACRAVISMLSAREARMMICDLFDVLWLPPDKEWCADTWDEVVAVFVKYDVVSK